MSRFGLNTLALNRKTDCSATICHEKTRKTEQHKHTPDFGDGDSMKPRSPGLLDTLGDECNALMHSAIAVFDGTFLRAVAPAKPGLRR